MRDVYWHEGRSSDFIQQLLDCGLVLRVCIRPFEWRQSAAVLRRIKPKWHRIVIKPSTHLISAQSVSRLMNFEGDKRDRPQAQSVRHATDLGAGETPQAIWHGTSRLANTMLPCLLLAGLPTRCDTKDVPVNAVLSSSDKGTGPCQPPNITSP